MTHTPERRRLLLGLVLCVLLSGFSVPGGGIGGTGQPQGGIGGTGVTAMGVIQRFGSIFVNGTEFHLLPATRYRIDGRPAGRRALHRGDAVFVEGHIRHHYATAASVDVQHALVGIVQTSMHHARVLRVLGQKVYLTKNTVMRPQTIGLEAGTEVAISAIARGPGIWQATRVHSLRPASAHAELPFLIRGTLQTLTSASARIGGVRFRLADMHRGPVAPGRVVVARGSYRSGHPVITAIRAATTVADARGARILIAGYFHKRGQAWHYDGSTFHAQAFVSPPAGRLAFVIVLRKAPDHFVIAQVTAPIDIMTFGLPPAPITPTHGFLPGNTGHILEMPRSAQPAMIAHPPPETLKPILPAMSRP